jgi:hypothetical protein
MQRKRNGHGEHPARELQSFIVRKYGKSDRYHVLSLRAPHHPSLLAPSSCGAPASISVFLSHIAAVQPNPSASDRKNRRKCVFAKADQGMLLPRHRLG